MKKSKLGFTLIEMLVVIAIIAVLVAVIIPVVGNSTNKAAAATNAANLRSIEAQLAIARFDHADAFEQGLNSGSNILGVTANDGSLVGSYLYSLAVSRYATFTADASGNLTIGSLTLTNLPSAKQVNMRNSISAGFVPEGTPVSVVIIDGNAKAFYTKDCDINYFAEIAGTGTSTQTPEDSNVITDVNGFLKCLIATGGNHEWGSDDRCTHCGNLKSAVQHYYYASGFNQLIGLCDHCGQTEEDGNHF